MPVLCEIVSDGTTERGWTGALGPFTAKVDGTALNLTGLTCTAQIRGSGESDYVDTTGDVTLGNQGSAPGTWTLNPDSADFTYRKSPYAIRLKVVDGSGKVVFFPSAKDPDYIVVGRP